MWVVRSGSDRLRSMNLKQLRRAERKFLSRYPGGFTHPDMVAVGRKHKMDRMIRMSQAAFGEDGFDRPGAVVDNLVKLVGTSSMVSMFEKPKFRSFANALNDMEKTLLADALQDAMDPREAAV